MTYIDRYNNLLKLGTDGLFYMENGSIQNFYQYDENLNMSIGPEYLEMYGRVLDDQSMGKKVESVLFCKPGKTGSKYMV